MKEKPFTMHYITRDNLISEFNIAFLQPIIADREIARCLS